MLLIRQFADMIQQATEQSNNILIRQYGFIVPGTARCVIVLGLVSSPCAVRQLSSCVCGTLLWVGFEETKLMASDPGGARGVGS